MRLPKVGVINYGSGNVLSVARAFEAVGANVRYIESPNEMSSSDLLVLPGVGAFQNAMGKLEKLGFAENLREVRTSDRRLLGICLGMQMLFDKSSEFGETRGLGFLEGVIEPIKADPVFSQSHKIPNIGWLPLHSRRPETAQIFGEGDKFYFVHSFKARPTSESVVIATAKYGDVSIPAVVRQENLIGCQFHPEKSRAAGLNLLHKILRDEV